VDLGTGGYHIMPSAKTEEYIRKSESFLSEHSKSIDNIVKLFGNMSARDLELRSTIIYLYKNYLQNGWPIDCNEIAADVKELKPYFNKEEILSAYYQLDKINVLESIKNILV